MDYAVGSCDGAVGQRFELTLNAIKREADTLCTGSLATPAPTPPTGDYENILMWSTKVVYEHTSIMCLFQFKFMSLGFQFQRMPDVQQMMPLTMSTILPQLYCVFSTVVRIPVLYASKSHEAICQHKKVDNVILNRQLNSLKK